MSMTNREKHIKLRKLSGLTQAKLAERLGLGLRAIHSIEATRRVNVSISSLYAVAWVALQEKEHLAGEIKEVLAL